MAGEASGPLGFEPHVLLEGPVDAGVDNQIAEHLLATLREALSNVVRHARATAVDVHLAVDRDVVLRVVDNGVGPPSAGDGGGRGLHNMARRAESLDGKFEVRPGSDGGTVLEWRVPATR